MGLAVIVGLALALVAWAIVTFTPLADSVGGYDSGHTARALGQDLQKQGRRRGELVPANTGNLIGQSHAGEAKAFQSFAKYRKALLICGKNSSRP